MSVEDRRVLEREQRLSRSVLWTMQREFYERAGPAAWSRGTVPHYVTSNPFTAAAYAQVVVGFLRDCMAVAPGGAGFPPLDPSHPVYVVELGAGPGRFAFHFLRRFFSLLERPALRHLAVRYVMTDLAERSLAGWRAHPSLAPWVEAGRLDFARYDATAGGPLALDGGDTLSPGALRNPLVVVANYVFGSIPQDAFHAAGGRLHESRVTITAPADAAGMGPELLPRLDLAYTRRPAGPAYYGIPALDAVLEEYRTTLADAAFPFPRAAMECVGHLRELAGERLLLLAADKGFARADELEGQREPAINVHGSLSMMANFDALGRYVRGQGGQVLHSAHRHANLNVDAYLFGTPLGGWSETRQAFDEAVARFGPDDFFMVKRAMEPAYDTLSLPQALAFLRLSGWDANVFLGLSPTLMRHAAAADEAEREDLRRTVREVWDNFLPIGEERDLPLALGALCHATGHFHDALEFFVHSTRLHGPHPSTEFNRALAYRALGERSAALGCVERALEMDPSLAPGLELRQRLHEEMQALASR